MDHLVTIAVMPGFLLMLFFYKKDEHEPEPREKVARVMGWGAAVSIVAIIVELILQTTFDSLVRPTSVVGVTLKAFIVAALVEELCKYWVMRRTIYDDPEFDEPYDGIVYCVAASLGFAIVENVLYVFSGGFGVGVVRALLAVPAHALFGVFLGYYVGLSKFVEDPAKRKGLIFRGLTFAVLAHGIYDFVLFIGVPIIQITVLPLMGVFWMLALARVRKLVAISPFAPGGALAGQGHATEAPVEAPVEAPEPESWEEAEE